MRMLKPFFLLTDIGFIVYWLITALRLIPDAYLYQGYHNPVLVAWNWSFLPLDLLISASGLSSLYLHRRGDARWSSVALVSLTLTFCSGLQALVFWAIRGEFDPAWWLVNGYFLVYPLFFIPRLLGWSICRPRFPRQSLSS
jgi:hypothetical protein